MAEDDDDVNENDNTGDDEWTPPTREDYEKTAQALAAARAEAKKYRLRLRDANSGTASSGSNGTPPPSAGPVDLEAERRKWEQENRSKVDARIISERARTALAASGLVIPEGQDRDAVISRAVRLLELDACTLEDSGAVSGLDAEIDALKVQYPGMFRAARRSGASVDGGTAGRSGARDSTTTGDKPSTAARLAARLSNGGRD